MVFTADAGPRRVTQETGSDTFLCVTAELWCPEHLAVFAPQHQQHTCEALSSAPLFEPSVFVVLCVQLCMLLYILDAATEDVSFSHQSEQLAESLQGLSSRIVRLYMRERERQTVCRYLCLCVYTDRLQRSVYQGHSTTPSSVHSAVPWYQWRPLGWPQLHRLPHQSNCNTRSSTVANVRSLGSSFIENCFHSNLIV